MSAEAPEVLVLACRHEPRDSLAVADVTSEDGPAELVLTCDADDGDGFARAAVVLHRDDVVRLRDRLNAWLEVAS